MDRATKTGIWIIATGVILTFLHFGRSILAPFALAVFLFLVIEGFATILAHRAFQDVPFYLEVPGFDKTGPDKKNMDLIKKIRDQASS